MRKPGRNLRKITLAVAAGTVLAAGGTAAGGAMASGPVDGSGVIHGCYGTYTTQENHGSHSLVLQDAGTKCPGGTTAISWNQQGPQGGGIDKGALTCQGTRSPVTGDESLACKTVSLTGPGKITMTAGFPGGLILSGFPPYTSVQLFDSSSAVDCAAIPVAAQIPGQSSDNGATWRFAIPPVCGIGGRPGVNAATSAVWFAAVPG